MRVSEEKENYNDNEENDKINVDENNR